MIDAAYVPRAARAKCPLAEQYRPLGRTFEARAEL